jgi:mannosyltransferase OCH1-like enzyme
MLHKLRHYIFINPNNVHANEHENLNVIKRIHKYHYNKGEIVKYWFYDDIYKLLQEYDSELAELFLKINVFYPALLADIGRYIILYNFGGVYCDLKIISNNRIYKLINLVKKYKKTVKIIGWQHAINKYKNSCIISFTIKNPFFNKVLQIMKDKLKIFKNKNIIDAKRAVGYIGSSIYINLFKYYEKKNITLKASLQKVTSFNTKIYSLNFIKWQNTHQKLFND